MLDQIKSSLNIWLQKDFTKRFLNFFFNKINIGIINPISPFYKKQKLHIALNDEYIRRKTLDLISNEIYERKIDGAIAELGVYRGDFAKDLNLLFYDRVLYLFDTFTGFDKKDIKVHDTTFSDTNESIVLAKMTNLKNVKLFKGYFPDSLNGLEERFSFVSLDADLFKPTYEGLKYFFPRLNKGGYIFIHDYCNVYYPGVKKAIDKFIEEEKDRVVFFVLPDPMGTFIISK